MAAKEARGWQVVAEFADEGMSGAKGRDRRPQLDTTLKEAVRRRFDVVMVWAVDRLGWLLSDFVGSMQELHGAKVDLLILQQGLDTTKPAGQAMFGILGILAEFERSMIQERVNAGIARARATGKTLERPQVASGAEGAIMTRLAAGEGMVKVAKALGVGVSTLQRVQRETAGQAQAA